MEAFFRKNKASNGKYWIKYITNRWRLKIKIIYGVIIISVFCLNAYAVDYDRSINSFRLKPVKNEILQNQKYVDEMTKNVTGEMNFEGAVPSRLELWGNNAFPLLQDKDGGVIAAGICSNSRAVVLGHDCFLSEKCIEQPPVKAFLMNSVNWLLDRKKNARVLLFNASDLVKMLEETGSKCDAVSKFPDNLDGYDLVIIRLPYSLDQNFTEDSEKILSGYYNGGGPVLCAGEGWVYCSYGDGKNGKSLENDWIANKLFVPRGLFISPIYGGSMVKKVSRNIGEWNHFLVNLSQFIEILNGEKFLDRQRLIDFAANFYESSLLRKDWREVLGSDNFEILKDFLITNLPSISPDENAPISPANPKKYLMVLLYDLLYRSDYEDFSPLREVFYKFPGLNVHDFETGRTNRFEAKVNPNIPRWHNLGVWARPGENLEIKIPENLVKRGICLQIGSHTDSLLWAPGDGWMRWPVISQRISITGEITEVRSLYGGIVYLDLPDRADTNETLKTETVRVKGGVYSPQYTLGDDPESWKLNLKEAKSPWVEFASKGMVITSPKDNALKVDDPGRLMAFWEKVAEAYPELLGKKIKNYADRYVSDRQISAGYMHAGYPVMTYMDVCDYVLGNECDAAGLKDYNLFTNGSWGHFHEVGHNHQGLETFSQAIEVTVNIFTLYVMDKVVGIRPGDDPYLRSYPPKVRKYLANPDFSRWSEDPFVALFTYIYTIREFGWEAITKTFLSYDRLSKKPSTDNEKIDTWVVLYSRAVGKNLTSYYRAWGWPVSENAEKEISDLPMWHWKADL